MVTPSADDGPDLVDQAHLLGDAGRRNAAVRDGGEEAGERAHSTGVLPSQDLKAMWARREISALEPIADDQFQPASLDLRLGATAYRVRASFLPGKSSVKHKLDELTMHEMDITSGGVLEKGCVYIIPLLEGLDLRHRTSAMGNPKSSTGRLDVFTRLITDFGTAFDQVREQYRGMLYAEVSPRTFSVLVRKGTRLSQLRVRRGKPPTSDGLMRRLQERHQLVGLPEDGGGGDELAPEIASGVPVSVDLEGRQSGGVIGYKARNHAGLVDLDRIGHYEVLDFWEPVFAPRRGGLVLDPAEFYILASREAVRVPPGYAAEMIAFDTLVGEFRVHYAGFFDPGFGHSDAGGEGSRAVLEVRSYEVPFVIEHGQTVGRLAYERLTSPPDILYGQGARSSYQGQGIKLSKHFKALPDLAELVGLRR
ncbi:MAG: 2'-deoxycytidine 5'-triphosphate deaminase [Caldimonas sp.]